jgi:hypothetical protein
LAVPPDQVRLLSDLTSALVQKTLQALVSNQTDPLTMPVLMSRQNAAVANRAVVLKRPSRNIGRYDSGKKDLVGVAKDRSEAQSKGADDSDKVETDRPGESDSMSVNIQPENDPKQKGQSQTLDIETKKSSVENWLKSQLGLEGSCKTIIEAHLIDKFHSRSLVEKRIRWEIGIFITYMLFLVFYSFAACGLGQEKIVHGTSAANDCKSQLRWVDVCCILPNKHLVVFLQFKF